MKVDPLGNLLAIATIGADGAPGLGLRLVNNARRLVQTVTFVDAEGQPALSEAGLAFVAFVHDARVPHAATRFLDAEGSVIAEQAVAE